MGDELVKWVKVPKPGQFRGEGDWMKLEEIEVQEGVTRESYFEYLKKANYLPTKELPEGQLPE